MSRIRQPRHNIISVRITDEEMMALKKLSRRWQTTTSRLMRGALEATVFADAAADGSGAVDYEQDFFL